MKRDRNNFSLLNITMNIFERHALICQHMDMLQMCVGQRSWLLCYYQFEMFLVCILGFLAWVAVDLEPAVPRLTHTMS